MADGAMTRQEREEFLADVHVGVLSVEDPGRGPLSLPIWYLLDGDDVLVSMDGRSKKARLLRAAGRASMVVQTEEPPYRYASIEGPVTLEPPGRDVLELATRYLGPELGAWYAEQNPADEHTVFARLVPEHWNTTDFGKLLG
jgi:PPOX class probable F420-dependent enzyme